jgi:hypothetical protein
LSHDGQFELSAGDADILVQVTGASAMWQKERLINVGINSLPRHVEYVAWLDCDIVFANTEWPQQAINALRSGVDLVQLFETMVHFPNVPMCMSTAHRLLQSEPAHEVSMARLIHEGRDPYLGFGDRNTGATQSEAVAAPGHAWAARTSAAQPRQLYDRNILGGADRFEIAAAMRSERKLKQHHPMTEAHFADFNSWVADRDVERIGYIPGAIGHLWHGDIESRKYMERYEILIRHGFDPKVDLILSSSGAWEWSNPESALASEIAEYFSCRREDG